MHQHIYIDKWSQKSRQKAAQTRRMQAGAGKLDPRKLAGIHGFAATGAGVKSARRLGEVLTSHARKERPKAPSAYGAKSRTGMGHLLAKKDGILDKLDEVLSKLEAGHDNPYATGSRHGSVGGDLTGSWVSGLGSGMAPLSEKEAMARSAQMGGGTNKAVTGYRL